ncbi:MAG: chemotaxis protein CheX [Planctomycetota bacterium]
MSTICEAVDTSIREAFSTMIGQELDGGTLSDVQVALRNNCVSLTEDSDSISVVVGLSGGLQGSVCLCVEQPAALAWTTELLGEECDCFNQNVIDAIGELGNLVVGGAKGRMPEHGLTLGLPSVVFASSERLAFPAKSEPVAMRYQLNSAEIVVLIALVRS